MQERDKHKLEGLLQARSEDMRHGRRPRTRRVAPEPPGGHGDPVADDRSPGTPAPGRRCATCGGTIAAHRVRAMPRATLCLGCRRAAEAAEAHS